MDSVSAGGLLILFFIVGWIVPTYLAMKIWQQRGGPSGVGLVMGLFLGWIGVVLAAVLTPSPETRHVPAGPGAPATHPYSTRECPSCKEAMRRDASVCPHCRRESKPWTMHEGRWWVVGEDGANYWLDEREREWIRFEGPPSVGATI